MFQKNLKEKKNVFQIWDFSPPSETLENCFPLRFGMESEREEVSS